MVMTKQDIANLLKVFLFEKKIMPLKSRDQVCRDFGIKKLTSRVSTSWGKRNLNAEHHWEDIDLKDYNPNNPVVVCLGGNGTENPADANGFCKHPERMLELLFKDKDNRNVADCVDLVSCVYGYDKKYLYCPDSEEFRKIYPDINLYAKDFPEAIEVPVTINNLNSRESAMFAKSILLSRCLDKDNRKIELEEACRRVSQVTFFTYCYGAQALNRIMDSFNRYLLLIGYKDEEIEKIKSSMHHVSFARKDYSRTIPSLFFYAVGDKNIGSVVELRDFMLMQDIDLMTRYCKKGEKAICQGMVPSRYGEVADAEALEFIYQGISNDDEMLNIQDADHFVSNIARDENWAIIHEEKQILDGISQMMSWALCRSVENGLQNAKSDKFIPKMPMSQLQEELMSIYNSFKQKESRSIEV